MCIDLRANVAGTSDQVAWNTHNCAQTTFSRWRLVTRVLGLPQVERPLAGCAGYPGVLVVKEAFGVAGGDIGVGAQILVRGAPGEAFATASGRYFDNDAGRFADPHPDALNVHKSPQIVRAS
jgi:hypothetical protein